MISVIFHNGTSGKTRQKHQVKPKTYLIKDDKTSLKKIKWLLAFLQNMKVNINSMKLNTSDLLWGENTNEFSFQIQNYNNEIMELLYVFNLVVLILSFM